jgi:hypothetical protein
MAFCSGLSGGGLHDGAGRSGEGHLGDSSELPVDVSPGLAAAAFGDAGQEQGQPADQDVGADAVFEAVEHWPEQQGGFEVPEAAFGFEEVLVAQRGVFGAEV